MTVDRAQRLIKKKYIQAKKMKFIRHPLAWALYEVWKMAEIEALEAEKKDGDEAK